MSEGGKEGGREGGKEGAFKCTVGGAEEGGTEGGTEREGQRGRDREGGTYAFQNVLSFRTCSLQKVVAIAGVLLLRVVCARPGGDRTRQGQTHRDRRELQDQGAYICTYVVLRYTQNTYIVVDTEHIYCICST